MAARSYASTWLTEEEETPAAIFAVNDLDAVADRLAREGVEVIAGGVDTGWLRVKDPDGNVLVFEDVPMD